MGAAMRRTLFVLAGALLLLTVGVLATTALSGWIADRFIRSDDDMNTFGKIIFLGVYPALVLVGGWLGNLWHRRNLTSR
jgi:uncharacterized membrane protein YeaQ/YmgE (transglycosylase-associated protein family)